MPAYGVQPFPEYCVGGGCPGRTQPTGPWIEDAPEPVWKWYHYDCLGKELFRLCEENGTELSDVLVITAKELASQVLRGPRAITMLDRLDYERALYNQLGDTLDDSADGTVEPEEMAETRLNYLQMIGCIKCHGIANEYFRNAVRTLNDELGFPNHQADEDDYFPCKTCGFAYNFTKLHDEHVTRYVLAHEDLPDMSTFLFCVACEEDPPSYSEEFKDVLSGHVPYNLEFPCPKCHVDMKACIDIDLTTSSS